MVFVIILFNTQILYAQLPPVVQWEFLGNRTESGIIGEDWVQSGIQTSQGGYLLCGFTEMLMTNNIDHETVPAIFKLDANGNLLWCKEVPNGSNGDIYNLITTSKNDYGFFSQVVETPLGYAVVGRKRCSDNNKDHIFFCQFDVNGNELYPGTNIITFNDPNEVNELGYGLAITPDNNYFYVTGNADLGASGNGMSDLFVAKLNASEHYKLIHYMVEL